jgi:type I pantothenate kinase
MRDSETPDVLDHFQANGYSPYLFFDSEEWAHFRADTPLTLTADEVHRLRSIDDPIDLDEVRRIYLSLSRLLSSHVESSQLLFEQRNRFLSMSDVFKTPFVIGIAGSVAVGKSTTARILKELLARWPSSPKVDLVTTDGFLYSNAHLVKNGILNRKGFPESYDIGALLRFLSAIKAGLPNVKAPSYSHLTYDVLPNEHRVIDRPDILIFEGINVLQSRNLPADGKIVPMVSDFFDFSIYIAIRLPISIAMRRSASTRRRRSPRGSGPTSTSRTCARTFCRPVRGPTSSCARAIIILSRRLRSENCRLSIAGYGLTRRSVRFIRPPAFRSVEVPG